MLSLASALFYAIIFSPFVPNTLFLYPLKISGGRERVQWEQMGLATVSKSRIVTMQSNKKYRKNIDYSRPKAVFHKSYLVHS